MKNTNISKLTKRDGSVVNFVPDKIVNAMRKAFESCGVYVSKDELSRLTDEVVSTLSDQKTIYIETVQNAVEVILMKNQYWDVAKAYITYRYKRALYRKGNTTDNSIMSLIQGTNKDLAEENANKSTIIAATQRDYMAGEVSRDLTRRILLPEHITKAHDEGAIHFHDMDYFVQPIFNCCLINIKDIFGNGTVMNDKMIEEPKSFQVACTVLTQVIACIASNQYGGQSVEMSHLGKYLRITKEKYIRKTRELMPELSEDSILKIAMARTMDELKSGIQTVQYQINTLMTTNGQSPFVTLFLILRDGDPYIEENALIIEEILNQRIQGIKNEKGVYVTPAFPKLVYVLDEHNCLKGGKYDYLTRLAVKCSAKRMYPDYISAKKMRENYEGNVFSPMGCVAGDEVVSYKLYGTLYIESFARMWDRLSNFFEVKEQQEGNKDYLYMDTPSGVEIFDAKEGFVSNYRVIRNKADQWVKVKFSNGRAVTCTSNHPFETENRGVVHASELSIDDVIRVDHSAPTGSKVPFNKEKAWFLGMTLCDGCYAESISISIAKTGEDDIQEQVKANVKRLYGLDTDVVEHERGVKGAYKDLIVRSNNTEAHNKLRIELISLFGGIKKSQRHIPNEVFSMDEDARMAFLAGMIDADGYINYSTTITKVQIGSTNKELAIQEMLLAQSLGMRASLYLNHYRSNNKDKIRYMVEFCPSTKLVGALVCEKKKGRFIGTSRKNSSILEADFCSPVTIERLSVEMFSYDVTTSSEHFTVSGLYSHNCRSFLAPWKNEKGEYQFEGRFNQGVVSLNLPQIGILAKGDEDTFWKLLDERLELCFEALMCRHKAVKNIITDNSPLHWQHGAIAREPKHTSIEKYLYGGYSSISLGYIGVYELTKLMKGVSHTDPIGKEFALRVMHHLEDTVSQWKMKTNIGFALYGTPAESLCYRFAKIDRERFGEIKDVTDKGYYTNSYHVDVREHIDAFAKLKFEDEFQSISKGGCISYIEIPNMMKNLSALESVVRFIYDNVQYAEFNTKSDVCHVCGFDGEIIVNEYGKWECPVCHNQDQSKMTVVRRTCGYLGEKFWNAGKTKEIASRVTHL